MNQEDDDFSFGDFTFDFGELDEIQTSETINTRILKREAKMNLLKKMKQEKAAELLDRIPTPGEEFHIISNGDFDYFDLVPILLNLAGPASLGYFSTWVLNRQNCLELLKLHDKGKLGIIRFLSGDYFKAREPAVYATLVEGLAARGGKVKTLLNHSKIALLKCGENHLVMEGSANFTANPRIEQNIIANDKKLFEFHENWIKEIFKEA